MKKILFTVLTLTSFATLTMAQSEESARLATGARVQNVENNGERAKIMADKINSLVNLTPEQYKKVLEIAASATEQRSMTVANQSLNDNPSALQSRPAINYLEKIMEVLTPEQKKKMEQAGAATEQTQMRLASPLKSSTPVQATPEKK